jgi:hypothetical protein
MIRSTLIESQFQRVNPAPVRALLYGTTYGIAAYTEGRLNRIDALSEKGRMRADILQQSYFQRANPAPVRALLYGTTYGISAYTEGRLLQARGIQEIEARRRPAIMTCLPGRIPS